MARPTLPQDHEKPQERPGDTPKTTHPAFAALEDTLVCARWRFDAEPPNHAQEHGYTFAYCE